MRILKKILLWLAIVIVAVSILAQFLPGKWEVTRTAVVNAEPSQIYPWIANIENWQKWNAFSYNDPEIVHTYPAAKSGVGAEDHWKSKKFGDGSAKILKAYPDLGITYELRFAARGDASLGSISFGKVEEGKTTVVYSVAGETGRNPVFRIFSQFTDKFLGDYFEESLGKLKALSENTPVPAPEAVPVDAPVIDGATTASAAHGARK